MPHPVPLPSRRGLPSCSAQNVPTVEDRLQADGSFPLSSILEGADMIFLLFPFPTVPKIQEDQKLCRLQLKGPCGL